MRTIRTPITSLIPRSLIVFAFVGAFAIGGVLSGCTSTSPAGSSDAAGTTGTAEAQGPGLVNSVTTQEGIAYTLYVGLADADTKQQELSPDEAAEVATPMISKVGGGYTVYRTQGGFTGDDGILVENDTLVYDGIHADEAAVKQLIDDLKTALNLESIYVTSEKVGYAIYGGQI